MLKNIETVENKAKESNTGTRLYRGVLITREGLKSYLEEVFIKEGLEDQIEIAEKTITCESNFLWYADNGISFGVAQFTPDTWKDFGEGDIFNPHIQLRTMAKMFKMGLQNRWDCYKMLNK